MQADKGDIMNNWIRKIAVAGATAVAIGATSGAPAQAAGFPEKPVTIVVAGPPGGGTDAIARILGADIADSTRQPVLVENRAGAGGIIGSKYVAGAPADGYTLLMGHVATNAIVPAIIKPRPYDPVKDFVPVAMVGTAPDVLVVSASSGIKSVADLLARARTSGKPLTYGSPGVGLPQHIAGFAFAKASGVPMQHVPYRGSAPALTDLIGGQITMMFVTPGAVVPFLNSGKLRAIAVTSHERSRFFPDVPTMTELGFAAVEESGWFGLFAPAGTPQAVIDTLSGRVAAAIAKPEVHSRLEGLYVEPATDSSARTFAGFVQSEVVKWAGVVNRLGVTAE
jgi:tripartite-type tricarboxylate transporter receptor subunit TctC